MQGNNLYTYAKSWNECLDICKKINGLSCCVWIERNMGMCGGTKKSKLKDFQGSSKIWAANCWLK